jgi:Domain of unknown function (DUF4406)
MFRTLNRKRTDSAYSYISGPISNQPNFNREQFYCLEEELKNRGWNALNPLEQDHTLGLKTEDCVYGKISRNVVLAADMKYICFKQPKIFVLPNWRKSTGTIAELSLAKSLGLPIVNLRKSTVKIICEQRKSRLVRKIHPNGVPETKQEETVQ